MAEAKPKFEFKNWVLTAVIGLLLAPVPWIFSTIAHASSEPERYEQLRKDMDTKVSKEQYNSDIQNLKEMLREIKSDLKDLKQRGR